MNISSRVLKVFDGAIEKGILLDGSKMLERKKLVLRIQSDRPELQTH
jgi:hypothetical protein